MEDGVQNSKFIIELFFSPFNSISFASCILESLLLGEYKYMVITPACFIITNIQLLL